MVDRIESAKDGKMDRFMFTLPAPKEPGELSFAVRYNDYWDGNKKRRYTVLFEREKESGSKRERAREFR